VSAAAKKLLGKGFNRITGGSYATLESVIPMGGDFGMSKTSDVYRAPAVGLRVAKGKIVSSNTTSQEMYIRVVGVSRHL
jgi:hypothetical protein